MLRNGLISAAGGVGGAANITAFDYVASDSQNRTLSSADFTFSAQSIGAADADRILVIGVAGFAFGSTIVNPTLTVGGVSATRVIDRGTANSTLSLTLFAVAYPTGTSADVVVAHGDATTCGIGIYRMLSANGNITPDSTDIVSDVTSPTTVSVSVSSGNQGSAIVGFSYAINGINPSWTGVTKDFGFDTRSTEWFSGASIHPSNTTGTFSVTRSETTTRAETILALWD